MRRLPKILKLILIIAWLVCLNGTDAYYLPYLIFGLLAGINVIFGSSEGGYILSVSWSFLIALANWRLFAGNAVLDYVKLLLCICGGAVVMKNVMSLAVEYLLSERFRHKKSIRSSVLLKAFFFISISAVYLVYLFFRAYPGNLSFDSIYQMQQVFSGQYNNHHPYYHTILIKVLTTLGTSLFGNINAGVATYSVFQIIIMAAIFSFALTTMVKGGAHRALIILSFIYYALYPLHIIYSVTMWKDILFGGMVLLLVTTLYRILETIGNNVLNFSLLAVSSVAVCIFRSNGLIAFLLFIVGFCAIYAKEILSGGRSLNINSKSPAENCVESCSSEKYVNNRKIVLILVLSALVGYTLKGPVLKALNVPQPSIVESLSVPLQQIANVLTNDNSVYSDVEEFMNPELVAQNYTVGIADPVKHAVLASGKTDFINTHKMRFLLTWAKIGVSHPIQYLTAWADQTKGYWNSGYDFWIWTEKIDSNDFGIQKGLLLTAALAALPIKPFITMLWAMGFFSWIAVIIFVAGLKTNKRSISACTLPVLAVLLTLFIATPVFSEYRYNYSMFTCLPMMVVATVSTKF